MNDSWFTSDWHLGHEGQMHHRVGYGELFHDREEHDEMILKNVFKNVARGDNLYFLGDLGWKKNSQWYLNLLTRFQKAGINFHWISGNHDPYPALKHKALKFRGPMKEIKIKGQKITLCHYPMLVWPSSHHGAWQLYGHIHYKDHTDNLIANSAAHRQIMGKQLNVNIEYSNYYPIPFAGLKALMSLRKDNFDLIEKHTSVKPVD